MKITPALFGLLLPFSAFSQVVPVVCVGTSNKPVIAENSAHRMDVGPDAFERVGLGSFVVFLDPSSPTGTTCHAVFKQIKPGVWWTKGVNNRGPDRLYVTKENFVGVLVSVRLPPKAKPQTP